MIRKIAVAALVIGLAACGDDSTHPTQPDPPVVSAFSVSPNENNRRAAAFKKLAATVPPAGTNVVLVSHKPNILDAFGKDWFEVREGEASVFKPDGNGGYRLVAHIQAGDWSKLAQAID